MPLFVNGSNFVKELVDAGVVPRNCRCFSIEARAGDVVVIKYEVYPEEADMRAVLDALKNNPDELEDIVRDVTFKRVGVYPDEMIFEFEEKKMSLDQRFMTHLPSLFAALLATNGPVLEIGAGTGSTPMLRAFCDAAGREFMTIEADEEWADRMGSHYDPNYSKLLPVLLETSLFWSVVFVDNAPALRRGPDAMLFKDSAEFVVIHDWESAEVRQGAGLPGDPWKYSYIDNRDPSTATFSMTREITWK